jgi:hypothetical protein
MAKPERNRILQGRPYVAACNEGNHAALPLQFVTIWRTISFLRD